MSGKKECRLELRLSDEEYDLIQRQMTIFGTDNMSAFIRKMAIDGMVIKLDMPEIQELLRQLRRANANINQIAKRLHETGRIYDTDLEEILGYQRETGKALNEILARLSSLK